MKFRLFKDKRFYESYQNRNLRDDLCAEHPVFREIFLLDGGSQRFAFSDGTINHAELACDVFE